MTTTTDLALKPEERIVTEANGSPFVHATVPTWDDDDIAEVIVGSLETGADGVEYLGCQTCHDEITRCDAGMCWSCRQDLAWAEQAS